jgi:hypothetical protein
MTQSNSEIHLDDKNRPCSCCGTVARYFMGCGRCRTRAAKSEPCKLLRAALVENFERHYGPVEDWKSEPCCDCKTSCKRKAYVAEAKAKELSKEFFRR